MRPPAAPRQPRREPAPQHHAPGGSATGTRRDEPSERRAPRLPRRAGRTGTPADRQPQDPQVPARPAARASAPARSVTAEPGGLPAARPGFLERLAERTRARRRLAWRKVAMVAGAAVLLGALAWLVLLSPVLALDPEEVSVSGVGAGSTVSRAEVMSVVETREGVPLARLDVPGLAEDLAQITTVAGVEVSRSWPRGLVVDVVARVPVAAASSGEDLVLLDSEGIVVGTVDEVPEGMARVTVPVGAERTGEALTAVLTVLADLPEELRTEVVSAGADSPAAVTLELADGTVVQWGSASESALKAAVLEVLRERDAAEYDVTVPRSPTVTD